MSKTFIYYISAFVSGMVVMAMELSASRLLAPYFGSSLYVWTNIIGLIMMALAGGYYAGGRLADKRPQSSMYFFLIFIIGIWILIIPFASFPLFSMLTDGFSNFGEAVRIGSFVAVFILFVAPMFFLGMLVPFTVKMVLAELNNVGRVSGKVSMMSTVGSFVGTFLPAFVLIPVLGTTKTFVCLGIVMLFLAAVGLRKWIFLLISLISVGFMWLVPPVYADDEIIYFNDSPYGFVFITEDEHGVRRLHVNNAIGTQSLYDPETPLAPAKYYYTYFGVLPAMHVNPETILILGHGGGSFTRIFNAYYPELAVTGVEIDPAMTQAAKEYMGLSDATVEIVHSDARSYLLGSDEKFDLILIDTYSGSNIPAHLATEEFFALVSSHLNEGGLVALNAASAYSEFLNTLTNSMAMHFDSMAGFTIPGSYNNMILGSQSSDLDLIGDVPPALQSHAERVEALLRSFPFDPAGEVFSDEKSTRVDILNDAMHMEIMSTL